jgi:hypothetical protein
MLSIIFLRTKGEVAKEDGCVGVEANVTTSTSRSQTTSGTVEQSGGKEFALDSCTCPNDGLESTSSVSGGSSSSITSGVSKETRSLS